jgi:hypothetical protein
VSNLTPEVEAALTRLCTANIVCGDGACRKCPPYGGEDNPTGNGCAGAHHDDLATLRAEFDRLYAIEAAAEDVNASVLLNDDGHPASVRVQRDTWAAFRTALDGKDTP